uniref:Uncharacterized protein n=1 Tax=Schizaphis graminum TaxID=13262 RepID=A0A2S2NAN3_SCHGA
MMFTESVLIMVLTIISAVVVASQDENGSQLKEMAERQKLEMLHKRINGLYCPPLGLTDRYNVTVVGAEWTWTGGCAYLQPIPYVSPSQLFHVWLRRPQNGGGGHCGDLNHNMDHFKFECLSKNRPLIEEEVEKGWQYVSLYDHTLFEYYERSKQEDGSNRKAYRCAIYSTNAKFPDVMWIAISGSMYVNQLTKCDGLSKMLKDGAPDVPLKKQDWSDDPMLLFLNKEPQLSLRKRSTTIQSDGCRFPDWSQGLWSNLQVDESVALCYENVIYDEDDVDFNQENDSESTTTDSHYQHDQVNKSLNYMTGQQENIQYVTRSVKQYNRQEREATKFAWRCIMPVDNDEKQQQHELGVKFLTYGGRVVEKSDKNIKQELNTLADNTQGSSMSYGCLWLESKGPNMFYSIIRTGMPEKYQDLQSFAQQLCTEKKAIGRDGKMRNQKKLCARRPYTSI